MKSFSSTAMATAILLASTTQAIAGAGIISTAVTTETPNVTYAVPASGNTPALKTLIIYTVKLASDALNTNTINNIRFTGATTTTAGANENAVFDSAVGASCVTTNAASTAIECAIGQLRAGQAFPKFTLFFLAPAKNTTLPDGNADCATSDCVRFSGTTFYAEGAGGLENSVPINSTTTWSADQPTTLGTSNPTRVKSGLGGGGGKLYTGTAGIPTPANKAAMVSEVPALTDQAFTTADLEITKVLDTDTTPTGITCGTSGNFVECPSFAVTIPGSFPTAPYLKNTYRVDGTNLKRAPSQLKNSVAIYYKSTAAGPEILVGACTNNAPSGSGAPCVLDKQCYKKSINQFGDLSEDCEWVLINTSNGFTRFQ
jgi:hypothetical protein